MPPTDDRQIDWSLTTWEGSERETLRRWSKLSLEQIVRAQEEMQELAGRLAGAANNAGRDQTCSDSPVGGPDE